VSSSTRTDRLGPPRARFCFSSRLQQQLPILKIDDCEDPKFWFAGGDCGATLYMAPCATYSKVFRDPHLNFAYGGAADFRGRHKALYNFLSAPGLSVNVKTEGTVFKMHKGELTVNGTFITEAHITARFSTNRNVTASFWASELDRNNFGWQVVTGHCVGRPFKFGFHGSKRCYELDMAMDYNRAKFQIGNWTVTVSGMPSCDTPVGRCLLAGPAHRLDVGFSARGDAPTRDRPHGIIGARLALRAVPGGIPA